MGKKKHAKTTYTLRERLGDMTCPCCGALLATRMDQGYGIAKLPDEKLYCKICADTIRSSVYNEGEPPTWTY